jgi:hypothetical protein
LASRSAEIHSAGFRLTILEGKTYDAVARPMKSSPPPVRPRSKRPSWETHGDCLPGSSPSYWVGRMLIRVKYIGLANIVAGKKIVPS